MSDSGMYKLVCIYMPVTSIFNFEILHFGVYLAYIIMIFGKVKWPAAMMTGTQYFWTLYLNTVTMTAGTFEP